MQEGKVDDTSATKLNQQYPHDDPNIRFTLAMRMQSYYVEVINIMYNISKGLVCSCWQMDTIL